MRTESVSRKPGQARQLFGRIGARLWVPFVIGALVSVAVVALLVAVSVNRQREQTVEAQRAVVRRVEVALTAFLTELHGNLETVANVAPLSMEYGSVLQHIIDGVLQDDPALMEVAVVASSGLDQLRVSRFGAPGGLADRSGLTDFQTAMTGREVFSPVAFLNDLPVMTVTVPVLTQFGQVSGVVMAQVDLSVLWSRVSDVQLGQSGYVYVVDDQGTLVAFRDYLGAMSLGGAAHLPAVSAAIASQADSGTALQFGGGLLARQQPTLAYYSNPISVGSNAWYVIAEQTTADAFAQVNSFMLVGVLLLAASIASIVLMGLYISRRVVLPISKLRRGASQLAAGDLSQRITGVQTGDELEFLASEFNEMASRLQEAQSSLAETSREREQQYEIAQQRVKEMSTLLQAGRAITSLDLESVLANLARESAGTAGADRCSIFVLDTRRNVLVLRGWWDFQGVPQPELEFGLGEGIVGWVAEENRSLFLANAQLDPRFVAKWSHATDVAAVMNLPLNIDHAVVGVLQVATRPGTPAFTREDQRLLVSLADQAAAAIKNSQLYEEERRRAQEMTVVAEINRAISASLELDTTLDAILRSVRTLIPYDLAEINLWDSNERVLLTRGRGADPRYVEYSRSQGGVYRLDEGFTGKIARTRQPLLTPDVQDGDIQPKIDAEQFPIRSHLGVPLVSGDELVGTLELAAYEPGAFTESHLETVKTIAGQAAVALQNAILFSEARRRADESATLARISTIAASALEPEDLLRTLMTEVGKLMKAQFGLVLMYNADTQFLEPLLATAIGDLPDSVADFRIDTTHPSFHRSVFSYRRVFRSDDALADRRILTLYRPFIKRYQVHALLSAPLIIRDRAIGELFLAKHTGSPFSDADEQQLSTVVTVLSNAIENVRLYAETQRRLQQLSLLGEIGRVLSSALQENEVLDNLYEQANRVVDARTLYVVYYAADLDEITFLRIYEDGVLIDLGGDNKRRGQNSLTFYVCRNRRPLLLRGDVPSRARELGIEVQLIASASEAKSWMGVPMIVGDRVLGMISVQHFNNPYEYDQNDLNLLQAIANQTGIALENARLYEMTDVRLSERLEELTALAAISQELNSTLDDKTIFKLVLDEAARVTGATSGAISLIDEANHWLEVRAWRGFSPQDAQRVEALRIPIGSGITGAVAATGEPALVNDIREAADYVEISPDTLAEIVVPIRYAQSIVGVLNLESREANAFTEDHLRFLNSLSLQAAIAIGNAQRYYEQLERGELLRRRAEQLTNLFQIGQAFRSDQPLEQVMDDVVHAIQETVGFNIALLSLAEGEPLHLRRVAAAGIPVATFGELRKVQQSWNVFESVLQDRFRISQSYYIPMEEQAVSDALHTYTPASEEMTAPREPGKWHPADMLLTPLRGSGDRILGILSVDEPAGGKLPDRAMIEALELFANQAAIAVENSRLYADLQQRLDNLTLFNEVGRTIGAKLDLDSLLTTVLDASIELLQCERATIFLRDPLDGKYVPSKTVGVELDDVSALRFGPGEGLIGQVVTQQRGIIVPDVEQDRRIAPYTPSPGAKSILLAPLTVAGQVSGVLSVDKPVTNGFSNTDLVVLSTLADQAAVAIDNARLYEETQRRLREQSLLYEAGQAISATLEYNQVLETVSNQLLRATNAQIVTIQEWDRVQDRLITVHTRYLAREGVERPGMTDRAFAPTDYLKVAQFLRDRRSISLRLNDPDLDPVLQTRMREAGLLWSLEVPLVARDEVLGLVRLGDGRFDRVLTDSEVQLVETLVNQAAVAMSNARLYDQVVKFTQELEGRVEERTRELERANEELTVERDRVETLFRITSELSASLDLDRVLSRALELVVAAVATPRGAIMLVDPQTDTLKLRSVLGGKEALPPGGKPTRFKRGEGLVGWTIVHRQPVIVADIQADERWLEEDDRDREFRSAISAPLSVGEDVLGAMLLLHPQVNYFTDSHLRLVSAAATQVATAINNAELYRYIREQAEMLGSMLRAQQVESTKSQAILESIADGVMVTDAEGRIILFNAAAGHILEVQRDEVVGHSFEDMLGLYSAAGPLWVNQVREWHLAVEARQRTPILSQRIEFQDAHRFVNVTVSPVTLGDEYLGSVSVFRDITREVEADRAKTEFVSTVSHELRTPMTSIKGYADLMLLGAAGAVNETQHRFLNVIKSNADRLSVLVNDLLDISRIESGRVKLDIKPISVESAIEQVVAALRGKIEEKGLKLSIVTPDEPLPLVSGDRDRVIQVLTNLVGNAYQYTESGGSITVRAGRTDGFVQIDVADTGIGIAPESQAKVFDRFYRADDPIVQEFAGTGLGLSIVKSLIEMHEGRIWLESTLGVGTTFSFTLKLSDVQPAPEEGELLPDVVMLEARHPAHAPLADGRRILVVEDDRDIAQLISRHLSDYGYQVSIAGRAKEAIEQAHERKPDLISLDIYLPDADGFEVLQRLKTDEATADIPVVIVSVMPDQHEGYRLGAVDYLTKPIDPLRLIASINRVLHGPGKVLVVDDDRDTRDLLQAALEQRGFAVVLTSSGKRALVLARQEEPNLILLDLKLPGMDGYEVLQKLKSLKDTAEIPVVVITGSLTDEELKRQKVLSLGAARFMTKPFKVGELVSEISELVGKVSAESVA